MEDARDGRAFVAWSESQLDEVSLIEAAKTDPLAFGELYEQYYPRVYRYVYHRLGNQSDAEDVTAVVFMKALEALSGYNPHRNGFGPWVFRIARNAVVDRYRRDRKQQPLEDIELQAGPADPVAEVLRGEQSRELGALIQHLSSEQRDVVLLRFAADLSYTEIAALLHKNEAAVRMLLHRALRKLKAVMNHV